MIIAKKSAELDKMRRAGKIVGDTLRMIEKYVRPGVSTLELDTIIEDFILTSGAIPSFKNYMGYKHSACISVDDVVVHGIPSPDNILKEGQIVSIDVGAKIQGFHGDAARTFCVGQVSEEAKQLVGVTKQSFFEGIKVCKAGRRLGDLSHAIQEYAESFGYGVVREMTGHGIGANLHEDPTVKNYGLAGTGILLKSGYTLAVEPMITLGHYAIYIEADGWTCKTRDGSLAAHYENTFVVTDSEPEILTL